MIRFSILNVKINQKKQRDKENKKLLVGGRDKTMVSKHMVINRLSRTIKDSFSRFRPPNIQDGSSKSRFFGIINKLECSI
jgi:hypothetical protein